MIIKLSRNWQRWITWICILNMYLIRNRGDSGRDTCRDEYNRPRENEQNGFDEYYIEIIDIPGIVRQSEMMDKYDKPDDCCIIISL